jgi:hypothetical protein
MGRVTDGFAGVAGSSVAAGSSHEVRAMSDANSSASRRHFLQLAGAAAVAGALPAGAADDPDAPLAPPDKQPPKLSLPKPEKKVGRAVVGLGELALGEIMPAFAQSDFSRS